MKETGHGRLMVWASEIDEQTLEQALKTSRLNIVHDHVSLMPDAHLGIGATVGSVIPTREAIIPAAVGVDIGCGMIAVETDLTMNDINPNIDGQKLIDAFEVAVPAGVGKGHLDVSKAAELWLSQNVPMSELTDKQVQTTLTQFGSLGSGNHFLELCEDERGVVWVVLHSGSRGIGNQLAQGHISKARQMFKDAETPLEDPDLAWFRQNTPEFDAYIGDMLWAQDYALGNRETMMDNALKVFFAMNGQGNEVNRINCHHNFSHLEKHGDKWLWITRKGAISAGEGEMGVIPGSMGTRSYIVEGLGEKKSWRSCSHGAGRRLSRTKARKTLTVESLNEAMAGKLWQSSKAEQLLDEHPDSYKDIDQVMADQADLVKVHHTLKQWANYKGTN